MTGKDVRVVGFGDLLLRLSTPNHERLAQANIFEARYTGAEANVAAMLSSLGVRADVVSRVPANEIGQSCVNYLRRFGVGTEYVARGGDRLGLFYLEAGASQRPSKVVYDRSRSSFATLDKADVDWEAVLDGADWLHFSGTAPAMGKGVAGVLREGLAVAASRGITVSCDLNYRHFLWSPEEAGSVMSRLMPYVDVLIGNEEDAITVFGLEAPGIEVGQGEFDVGVYRGMAEQLTERFGFKYMATTLRRSISASVNGWSGILYDGDELFLSREYEVFPIIDRVGTGDSFGAGLIFGLLKGWAPQRCVDFAVAGSCLKHSVVGDFNLVTQSEIDLLLEGNASGRIQR